MSATAEQRKLAAIMFTDMVGYSALSQRDGKLAVELLEEHREILRKIFPKFNGTEIKTIGDAFLVEFNSALEAAQRAIEIQRTFAKRNADAPAHRQIELKIGIHIGDVVHRDGDVYGDGVNIASRIESVAGAGGICVSMDVERQIRNAVETRFEKLATTELKNISVPMDLFRIVLPWEQKSEVTRHTSQVTKRSAMREIKRPVLVGVISLLFLVGIGWWWTSRPHKNVEGRAPAMPNDVTSALAGTQAFISAKGIAVLPFDNLSQDPNNAFFAEGVQDEILTRLAKVADLKVIARTSTQRFKSAPENLPDIAKQLGVMNILEGSVQKVNDQVRVNVQLINALTNAHLWAEIYDRKLTDIFAVESEIAKTIADTLQAKLTGSEKAAMSKKPTENSEAYELYLKGRFFWNKRTAGDMQKAADYYNQAIAKDPNYALAYAGLAEAYVLFPDYGVVSPSEAVPRVKDAAAKALSLDATLAEPHAALGDAYAYYDYDVPKSIAEFERAIQLNPNYATAHQWFNTPLQMMGDFDRAIAETNRAIELDPLSLIINSDLAFTYLTAHRFDEALAQSRKVLEMDPNFHVARGYLAEALQLKGQLQEAVVEYRKAAGATDESSSLAQLAQSCARAGQREEAQQILARLLEMSRTHYVSGYVIAWIYSALGDKARAIDALENAYAQKASELTLVKYDPLFDDLHGEPRFDALVEKITPARASR